MHRRPSELLSPNHKDNHSDNRKTNGKSHHRHHWWNKPVFSCPIVEVEDHTELYASMLGTHKLGKRTYAKGVLDDCTSQHDLARNVSVAVDCILEKDE